MPRTVKAWEEPTASARFIRFIEFGTLGEQDADAVVITGGTMSGLTSSVAAGISAAGSNQGDATVLVKNDVTTVDTVASGAGVILPAGVLGDKMFVWNGGLNPLDVYPVSSSAIDAESVNVPIILAVDTGTTLYAASTTLWVTHKFGSLGAQNADAVAITGGTIVGTTVDVAAGISAAGTDQGGATVLAKVRITEVSTVGANSGVILPEGVLGDRMFVYNGGVTEDLDVYPFSGSAIDAGGANAAITLANDVGVAFYAVSSTLWVTNK